MLVIEKEGIAEQLAPFADEMGIGLLNTRVQTSSVTQAFQPFAEFRHFAIIAFFRMHRNN